MEVYRPRNSGPKREDASGRGVGQSGQDAFLHAYVADANSET